MRLRDRGVTDIRSDQDAARWVEGKTVRLHAHPDLESVTLGTRCKHGDGVLTSIGGKDESTRFGHENAGHRRQAGDRFEIFILRDVDHIDRVVAGVRDVEPVCGSMNVRVIESAARSIGRQLDVTE